MIKISKRVLHAINLLSQGEYEFALQEAVIAIDVSAKKYYSSEKSSAKNYKNLLREYYWILELFGLNGVNLLQSSFSNLKVMDQGKIIANPNLFDIIYHIMRCHLVHNSGIPENMEFNYDRDLIIAKEFISLPIGVIWGLLAIVVFSKINIEETSEGNAYFTYTQIDSVSEKWEVSTHWGKEEVLRRTYEQYVKTRVNFQISKFTEKNCVT
ncbi:MAG: hypothetical protein AB7H48_04270 [Parachlamydiales bacterium]